MPKLERINQLIFANNAGSREVTSFGTAKNQDPTYTRDVAAIQNSNYLQGWNSAVLPDKAPYMEDSNGLYYMITRQLAYLFQMGLAEWNADTTYYQNSFVQVNGAIYYSLTNDNTGYNPTTNPTYWADFWGTVKTDIATLNTNVASLSRSIADLQANKANLTLSNVTSLSENFKGLINPIRNLDYNARQSWTTNTFTAPADGMVFMSGKPKNETNYWIKVNNIAVLHVGDDSTGATYNGITIPVASGDVVTNKLPSNYFFPYKTY